MFRAWALPLPHLPQHTWRKHPHSQATHTWRSTLIPSPHTHGGSTLIPRPHTHMEEAPSFPGHTHTDKISLHGLGLVQSHTDQLEQFRCSCYPALSWQTVMEHPPHLCLPLLPVPLFIELFHCHGGQTGVASTKHLVLGGEQFPLNDIMHLAMKINSCTIVFLNRTVDHTHSKSSDFRPHTLSHVM